MGNQNRMSTITTLIQHSSRHSSQCNMSRKGNKRCTDQKRKLSLFCIIIIWHNCPCGKPKEHTHENIIISVFSKFIGHKTYKNQFLYINNEHIDAKIKYTIFIMTKIKTKYLGLILTMHVCTRRPCFTKKWWKKPST